MWPEYEPAQTSRLLFVDIGELGWSLYLSGHVQWLRRHAPWVDIVVMTLPERMPLYAGGCRVVFAPVSFSKRYADAQQDGFGLEGVSHKELLDFFSQYADSNDFLQSQGPFKIPSFFRFGCTRFFDGMLEFSPYQTHVDRSPRRVLLFPRLRPGRYAARNLPEEFWSALIHELCLELPHKIITTCGRSDGVFRFPQMSYSNFDEKVSDSPSLQNLIDLCAESGVAIGSASAPPKISLIQGVPTFVIGHEKERVIAKDNWCSTPVGFHTVEKFKYDEVDTEAAVAEIMEFVCSHAN